MSRTVIRYPGSKPRYVGPFGDEAVARSWFDRFGGGGRVKFLPLEAPSPPPRQLPRIPRRIRIGPNHGGFTRVDELADEQGQWFILGPDTALPLGHEVRMWQRASQDYATVIVDYYVAERTVRHLGEDGVPGEPTRYVLAAFTNVRDREVCDG